MKDLNPAQIFQRKKNSKGSSIEVELNMSRQFRSTENPLRVFFQFLSFTLHPRQNQYLNITTMKS